MTIKRIKATVFQTSDGRQFLEADRAKRHQIGIELKLIFERSVNSYRLDADALGDFIDENFGAFERMFAQNITGE